jgi:hypothetical protein
MPTLVKKRKVGGEIDDDSSDTVPEIMKEDVPNKVSSDTDPVAQPIVKKKEEAEDVTSSDPDASSENPVAS